MHAIASIYQVYTTRYLQDVNVLWGRSPRPRKPHSMKVKVNHDFLTAGRFHPLLLRRLDHCALRFNRKPFALVSPTRLVLGHSRLQYRLVLRGRGRVFRRRGFAFRLGASTCVACLTHALHIAVTHRVWHTTYAMKIPLAAATFVACKARRARRVLLEPAVHSRCAGHGQSRRGSSTSCLCTAAAARSWAGLYFQSSS